VADSLSSTTHFRVRLEDPMVMANRHLTLSKPPRLIMDDATWTAARRLDTELTDGGSQIGGLEFVKVYVPDVQKEVRGVILFDRANNPDIHVIHALLGYDGNGPGLSKHILGLLGLPDEAFTQINDLAKATFPEYAITLDLLR
jgi:hypothetical protein